MTKHRIPALTDILHYNNRDTLLVSELLDKTKAIDYIYTYAYDARISMTTVNTNYDKIQYRLLNRCEIVALENQQFLTIFKTVFVASSSSSSRPQQTIIRTDNDDDDDDDRYHGISHSSSVDFICVKRNAEQLLGGSNCSPTPIENRS